MMNASSPLISADDLLGIYQDHSVRILDASFYLPDEKRDADSEFIASHIPTAQRFDLNHMSDPKSSLPHMLPSMQAFTEAAQTLGISQSSQVIVYDTSGLFGAARAWWMFRVFGHPNIRVLDGGLAAWQRGRGALEAGEAVSLEHGDFVAAYHPEYVAQRAQVETVMQEKGQIVDARSAQRFIGTAPEPRPGLRSGHIPGSTNIPLAKLLNKEGMITSTAELKLLFNANGLDFKKPIVASCGSGITACGIALGLDLLGVKNVSVYDGSWAEWGSTTELPIEAGQ